MRPDNTRPHVGSGRLRTGWWQGERMLTVGLTGGIGAGKSAVAHRLADLGAIVIDADVLARNVVQPGSAGLAAVIDAFGPDVVDDAGNLDRSRLASLVFADSAARTRLEAIVHPLVRAKTRELIAAAPDDAIVINEVPLLVEANLAADYDVIVVVQAQPETRLRRLVDRGLSAEEARQRIAAQASDVDRRAVADYLIDNDGTLDDLVVQVDRLWQQLLQRLSTAADRRP